MDYKIIFVFVFIFILISLLRKKNENWENLQNDNYFDNFNYYDLKFRGCNDKESCKKRYSEKVLSFSPEEEIIIVKIIENFNNLINNKFRFIFNQINFIKVDNEIESTMPHTRGNNIIFAKSWVNNMINNFFKQARSSFAEGLGSFYTYERQVPEIAVTKIKGLKKFYGIDSKEGLMFFEVHKEADILHRSECEKLLDTLNDEEKKLAEKAALTTAKFMWNFLSGLAIKHKLPLQTAA